MTAEHADLPGYVGKLDDVTADQSKSSNLSISITKNSWDDHKVAAPDEIVREIIVHNKKGDVTINRLTTIDNTTGQANLTKQDVAKTPPVVVPQFNTTTMVTPKATREAIEQRANIIKQNAALQLAKE